MQKLREDIRPVFLVLGMVFFICTLINKSIAQDIKAKKLMTEVQREQESKEDSTVEEKALDELIKKYKDLATQRQTAAGTTIGKKRVATDFDLQDIYQDYYRLKEYKNKQPLILFFWTTWCPYCERELAVLNNMYPGLVKDGFMVFAINVGELPDTVTNFVKGLNLAYRVLLDSDTAVSGAYQVIGVPTYVLVNQDGYIVFQDSYFPQDYKDIILQ
jgi:peroxiredoxin